MRPQERPLHTRQNGEVDAQGQQVLVRTCGAQTALGGSSGAAPRRGGNKSAHGLHAASAAARVPEALPS